MLSIRPARKLLALAILAALAGCKVDARDIDHWQRTERGPEKLAAVVHSHRYDDDLRARALLSLATMDRTDVQPVAEFERAITELREQHDPSLPRLIDALVPGLETAMRGGERPARPGQPPTDLQANAKDAAFVLLRDASGATRERLGRALVGWFAQDFARRHMAGRTGVEDVVGAVGSASVAELLPALDAHLDKDAMVRICEIIARHGDAATKNTAATRIVAIEREMESAEFLDWVKGEIRRAMTVNGAAPAENRVAASAVLTRESLLTQGAIAAMKPLAGSPVVADRLITIARTPPPAGTSAALAELIAARGPQALVALEDHVAESHVDALLALALDATAKPELRELAFDRLGDSGSRRVIAAMWPLVGVSGLDGDTNAQQKARQLRWRAGELVLELGGAAAIPQLYAHLPVAPTTPFEPSELEGYANRIATIGDAATATMRADLASPIWWRRVIAIRHLARTGTASDVPRLERMVSDATPTVGTTFQRLDPPQTTVGKIAESALAAMRERLAAPTQPATP